MNRCVKRSTRMRWTATADQLRDLVGKQVRVTGTIAESSNLRRDEADSRRDDDRREGLDISTRDLAKVDVQDVVQIADVCGNRR